MRIIYFSYNPDVSTGAGPRKQMTFLLNGMVRYTDFDIQLITKKGIKENIQEQFSRYVKIFNIVDLNPLNILRTVRNCKKLLYTKDIVHVPLNVFQAVFVRFCYSGPIVVGDGMQPTNWSAFLLKNYIKPKHIFVANGGGFWLDRGFSCSSIYPAIDTEKYKPYSEEKIMEIRKKIGISANSTAVLFVGEVSKRKGAHIFYNAFKDALGYHKDIFPIIIGRGPLERLFKEENDIHYIGPVREEDLPIYYNIADITLILSERDIHPIVGIESMACGTPVITTARISKKEIGALYLKCHRNRESILESINHLMSDDELYNKQVKRGLSFVMENCSLKKFVEIHMNLYKSIMDRYREK